MGKRGPKKKPTALRVFEGNPGHVPIGNEAKPDPSIPTPPDHLSDVALVEWRRVTPHLSAIGLLSQIDRASLAAYCQAYARWVEAETAMAKYGAVLFTREQKWPVLSPYYTIAMQSAKQMKEFMSEFGMSPASRVGLKVDGDARQADELDEFKRSG